MLRYVKSHMESIDGIEVYPLISLAIFFTFFVGLIIYVFMVDKSFIRYMEMRPLETESDKEHEPEAQSE